jgi:hypothetical protein
MFELQVGQELTFIAPVAVDGETLPKGTRIRVGHILAELPEEQVMIVLLDQGAPRTLTVGRHVVTRYCMPTPGQ